MLGPVLTVLTPKPTGFVPLSGHVEQWAPDPARSEADGLIRSLTTQLPLGVSHHSVAVLPRATGPFAHRPLDKELMQ